MSLGSILPAKSSGAGRTSLIFLQAILDQVGNSWAPILYSPLSELSLGGKTESRNTFPCFFSSASLFWAGLGSMNIICLLASWPKLNFPCYWGWIIWNLCLFICSLTHWIPLRWFPHLYFVSALRLPNLLKWWLCLYQIPILKANFFVFFPAMFRMLQAMSDDLLHFLNDFTTLLLVLPIFICLHFPLMCV